MFGASKEIWEIEAPMAIHVGTSTSTGIHSHLLHLKITTMLKESFLSFVPLSQLFVVSARM